VALFPAELAKQGAQRGPSQPDAALLSRETRAPIRSVAAARPPTARPVSHLANPRTGASEAVPPCFRDVTVPAADDSRRLRGDRNRGSRIVGRRRSARSRYHQRRGPLAAQAERFMPNRDLL
jgi:hypothetical protein